MAVALPRVTRQQLKERERDWYDSGAVMSRAQGGHGRPAEALQPVKYMLEQTCITLSKAEASDSQCAASARQRAHHGAVKATNATGTLRL